jgi:hypothetical protein
MGASSTAEGTATHASACTDADALADPLVDVLDRECSDGRLFGVGWKRDGETAWRPSVPVPKVWSAVGHDPDRFVPTVVVDLHEHERDNAASLVVRRYGHAGGE